jgi:hypothetical protein
VCEGLGIRMMRVSFLSIYLSIYHLTRDRDWSSSEEEEEDEEGS